MYIKLKTSSTVKVATAAVAEVVNVRAANRRHRGPDESLTGAGVGQFDVGQADFRGVFFDAGFSFYPLIFKYNLNFICVT